MESTILREVSPAQIAGLFERLQNQLNDLKASFQPKVPDELLTRAEAAELLKCDLSTLWNWQQKGKLIPYGLGNGIYYKRSDIEAALVQLGKKRKEGSDNEI